MSNVIQLYSLDTPNGQKVGVALEEMGLQYEAHVVNIMKGEQFDPEFLKISPNNKIPAIVDPSGPDGEELALFESGAILLYLAEKTNSFLGNTATDKVKVLQWLFFQMGGVGPMFGQFGHFHKYAPEKIPYAVERYSKEVKRLLGVLENQLESNEYIAGDFYSIADMAIVPWIKCLDIYYNAKDLLEVDSFPRVTEWVEKVSSRPAYERGAKATPFSASS